eukprot:TRINITY_DN22139_c0_g1_i1.p2 TRINITY_DN22139_c0_g1~~TRINITY_DN22139_c0_g1_i1.p2  ORF type:complete len:208 (-),score=66.79 TRINITY_DN22139_c0_g1_i1:42-665(-)
MVRGAVGAAAAAALLVVGVVVPAARGVSFYIEPHHEECMYEEAKQGDKLGVGFQVTQGGNLDIDFKVLDPGLVVLYAAEMQQEGRFTFTAERGGEYAFCFSNKMSQVTLKQVTLTLDLGDARDLQEIALQEHLTPLENTLAVLTDGLQTVQREQNYLRARERTHRQTSESTSERVLYWSLAEAAVLIAISVWQMFYLKRFFEVKAAV